MATLAEVFCVLGEDGLNVGVKSNAIILFPVALKLCCLHHVRDFSVTFQYVNSMKRISVTHAYKWMSALSLI